MATTTSALFIAEQLAELLHPTSAYEIASICDGFGLASTDKQPMQSKRSYVRDRVNRTNREQLPHIARLIVREYAPKAETARQEEFGYPEWLKAFVALASQLGMTAGAAHRNWVFASLGKPDLVITDVARATISDVSNVSLVYSEPIAGDGLTLGMLKNWWYGARGERGNLYDRLAQSVGSASERALFDFYARTYVTGAAGQLDALPAMLPQVWLHYDPLTREQRLGQKALPRQRLDFAMILPGPRRVVIEVNGPHHFTDETGKASLETYAEGVAADRGLTLDGWSVFRFGANEMSASTPEVVLRTFFDRLLGRE